jgi:ABC-2 type transport system permease protein
MWTLIVKEFRQVRRDRRTVAMIIVMPLMLLVVFGYAASFDVDRVSALAVGPGAGDLSGKLPDFFDIERELEDGSRSTAVDELRGGEADVAFVTGPSPEVLIDGSSLFSARSVLTALGRMPDAPQATVLFNPGLDTSTVMVPALAGMILIFIGGMITSLGVVRERQTGTLEQLAVMPFRPRDVFVGKIAPYFVLAAIDLTVILAAGSWLFDVPFRGSYLVFTVGALLFLFVTLGLGVLISTVSQNQGQAIQLALMTLLPQVLLSGMIFPLESMAAGIRWIAYLLPLTYFIDLARAIMIRGAPVDSVVFSMTMLTGLGLAVFTLALIRFRRDLAPSARRKLRSLNPVEGVAS